MRVTWKKSSDVNVYPKGEGTRTKGGVGGGVVNSIDHDATFGNHLPYASRQSETEREPHLAEVMFKYFECLHDLQKLDYVSPLIVLSLEPRWKTLKRSTNLNKLHARPCFHGVSNWIFECETCFPCNSYLATPVRSLTRGFSCM